MAPEFNAPNMPDSYNPRPTKESDVYAFGILMLEVSMITVFIPSSRFSKQINLLPLFQLLSGQEPYWYIKAKLRILVEAASNGLRPNRARYTALSDNQWELLEQCWVGEPEERPSMEKIIQYLTTWPEPAAGQV